MLSIFLCWSVSSFQPDLPDHRARKRCVKPALTNWWGSAPTCLHPIPISADSFNLADSILLRGVIFCYSFDKKYMLSCLLPNMLGVVPRQVEGTSQKNVCEIKEDRSCGREEVERGGIQ